MHPFVALMRKCCIDYANSHNQDLCREVMEAEYAVHISGVHLSGRESGYRSAVSEAFRQFPGVGLVVHEMFSNGERLALRFSEHAASPDHGNNLAAWSGIALFRWNGERLTENWMEQDFWSRSRQLRSGSPDPLEPPHLDPWVTTVPGSADPAAEQIVREWLHAGRLDDAPHVILDDSLVNARVAAMVDVTATTIDDIFSVGDRVAFHVTEHGLYAGGLPGLDDRRGVEVTLPVAGIAMVRGGAVDSVRAITDRYGLVGRLRQSAERVSAR